MLKAIDKACRLFFGGALGVALVSLTVLALRSILWGLLVTHPRFSNREIRCDSRDSDEFAS